MTSLYPHFHHADSDRSWVWLPRHPILFSSLLCHSTPLSSTTGLTFVFSHPSRTLSLIGSPQYPALAFGTGSKWKRTVSWDFLVALIAPSMT